MANAKTVPGISGFKRLISSLAKLFSPKSDRVNITYSSLKLVHIILIICLIPILLIITYFG